MPEPTVHIEAVTEPNFGENAYCIWTRAGGPCWLVDPGLAPSAAGLKKLVARHELLPAAIVLTHAHADHIAGIPEIMAAYGDLPVLLADEEAELLADPWENLSAHVGAAFSVDVKVRRDLAPGTTIALDDAVWRIIDVAGHSPAGRALYCATAGLVVSGDALFAGSIGRTDFPHSDGALLLRNIRENLFALPDATVVYSGHGETTTIGEERRYNPFVGETASERGYAG